MRSHHILSLALVSALAITPSAFAQDTAAGKRFSVVGGVALLEPASNPANGIKLDGGPAPTLSFSWNINDNYSLELWGAADKFDSRVRANGLGNVGNVEQQPIALSGQYHFGNVDNTFRPFVGVGYYYNSVDSKNNLAGNDYRLRLKNTDGAIGTVGVDLNITPTWFARADVRYMHHSRSDLRINGQNTGGRLKLDPWTAGFGIGARF